MGDDITGRLIRDRYVRANMGTMLPITRRVRGIFSVRRNTGSNINFYRDPKPRGHNRGSSRGARTRDAYID